LDVTDALLRPSETAEEPAASSGAEQILGDARPHDIGDMLLADLDLQAPGQRPGDRDALGGEVDSIDRDSEFDLTLEEHRLVEMDDLDTIFDSTPSDQPTLARDEIAAARPSGSDSALVGSTDRQESSAFGEALGQESVPTDLLSSQWQIDSGIWDETATKLDLARAYIEMEDKQAAREILEEVLVEGREEQRVEAQSMLDKLA
jgi:pilus assembly protein FimV